MTVSRRSRHPLIAFLIGMLASGPVIGQSSGLKRLTLRQDVLGWEAVGRLELDRGGYCSGVLIAPDLVLTAAHCLVDRSGRLAEVPRLRFRAGLRDGVSVAERTAARAVVHPGYRPSLGVNAANVSHDVALVQLAEAIPAAVAAPFAVAAPGSGTVSVVSYARGRDAALSRQAECRVLGRQARILAFDCDVTFGASGAPVFDDDAGRGRGRIVSLISSGFRGEDGGAVAFGMELPTAVADLKRALRAGLGVFPVEEVSARRLRVGADRAGSGARFVRP